MGGLAEEIDVGAGGLVLRRWRAEDAPALLDAIDRSLPELRRFLPWAAEEPTPESVRSFLDTVVAGPAMGFGLREAGGDLIGGFGVHDRRGPGILEIGYWVRSDRTGRGYATATARALSAAVLDAFPLIHRLEIRCDPANGPSAAIPPKLGYRLDRIEDSPVEAAAQTGRQQVWVLDRSGQRFVHQEHKALPT